MTYVTCFPYVQGGGKCTKLYKVCGRLYFASIRISVGGFLGGLLEKKKTKTKDVERMK